MFKISIQIKVKQKKNTQCKIPYIQEDSSGKWRRSGVFIVNFEYVPHLFQVFPLLTSDK